MKRRECQSINRWFCSTSLHRVCPPPHPPQRSLQEFIEFQSVTAPQLEQEEKTNPRNPKRLLPADSISGHIPTEKRDEAAGGDDDWPFADHEIAMNAMELLIQKEDQLVFLSLALSLMTTLLTRACWGQGISDLARRSSLPPPPEVKEPPHEIDPGAQCD
jgi:hypothetical protein